MIFRRIKKSTCCFLINLLKFKLIFSIYFNGFAVQAQSTDLYGLPMKPLAQFTSCNQYNLVAAVSKAAIDGYQQGNKSLLLMQGEYISTMGWFHLTGCDLGLSSGNTTIEKNFIEAKYWLDWGIQANDYAAHHNLAWMYQNGLGIPMDRNKSKELYKKIINSKMANPAIIKISIANLNLLEDISGNKSILASSSIGQDVSPSVHVGNLMAPEIQEVQVCKEDRGLLDEAARWAASSKNYLKNDPDYLKMRCRASYNGKPAVCKSAVDYFSYAGYFHSYCAKSKDYEEAKYWFELGDLGEDPSSISNLAWLYQNGLGVAKNELIAARLYSKLINLSQYSPAAKKIARENLSLIPPSIVAKINNSEKPIITIPAVAAVNIESVKVKPTATNAIFNNRPFDNKDIRKALIIGNDNYRSVAPLKNAREDAKAIASTLQSIGDQVVLKLDLNEKDMKAAIRNFSSQINGGDEVLFYYAGHGVQLGAANYLLPVDIGGDSEAQVRDDAIQLQRVLDDMVDRRAKFTLAVVDACRDNPFKSAGRSIGGRGLAPTSAATGQMIIFSAGVGQQALDQLGPKDKSRNGLFTRVFLKEIQKPGVSVDRVVRNVRSEVVDLAKSVGHEQVPAIYDQVVGDFYFKR